MDDQASGDNGLPDGRYDVLIIDADLIAGSDGEVGLQLEIVVTAGEFKGDVVELKTSSPAMLSEPDDPVELLARPGSLTVSAGMPHLSLS